MVVGPKVTRVLQHALQQETVHPDPLIGSSERQVCRHPGPDGRRACVNAREGGSSAPVSPAGHPSNKPLARELLTDQWTAGVSLEEE